MDELIGAEIVWFDDWRDGPLDGLVSHDQRELWFCIDRAAPTVRPRTYLVFELTDAESAHIHAVRRADAQRTDGPRDLRALGTPWEDEDGHDEDGYLPPGRTPVGWFTA